jgi:hypothetical protein
VSKRKAEKRDPAQVTAAEFIAALLPPSPNEPALGDACVIVSSPFVPKGEDSKQWPPVAYHAGAAYAAELYVNWAVCNVVEFTDRNGNTKQGPKATNAAFAGQYFLMLDDIGNASKSTLTLDDPRVLGATYLMETSEGNYQVGYALAEPMNATESAQLRAALVTAKLGDAGSLKSAHRWCRVPGSVNAKPERNGFKSVLRSWNPECVYTLAALCELLDVFLDTSVQAPELVAAKMPDDIDKYNDAHFRWMRARTKEAPGEPGTIMESRRSTGFFPIVCPWADEHTHGRDGAGYRPGFGDSPPAFNCHHSHNPKITTSQFIEWCIEQQQGSPHEPAPKVEPVAADDFYNYDTILNQPYPDWLIEELFARRQVGAIYGDYYVGKSTLAFAITMALAGGADVLGDLEQWENGCAAIYFALEGNLRTRTEPFEREKLLTNKPNIRFERTLALSTDSDSFDGIRAMVEESVKRQGDKTALVVIDTLARASHVDENSADLGTIAEECRLLAEEFNVCVLIVHHSGKDATKGLRGHSSLGGALDFTIEVNVEADADGKVLRRTFTVHKQREGEGNFTREFEIRGVELGRHPKRPNKRVTGPVAIIKPGEAKKATSKLTGPKGKNQKIVYSVLKGMLLKASRHPEATLTQQGWGVPTEALCDAAAAKLPKKPGHDRRRERAREALIPMTADGWIWFVEGDPQYIVMPHFVEE